MRQVLAFLRERFFGTWDRGLTSIALIATLIGTFITVFLVKYPDEVPKYIAYRDTFIWSALILLCLVVVIKYVRRETVIQSQKSLLTDQFRLSHELVHNFKDELFDRYFQQNIQRHELNTKERSDFRDLCSYITDDVRTAFSQYFKSRGIDIGNDISVSVKLIIRPEEVSGLLSTKLTQEQQQDILLKDQWVITVYRDPYTHKHHKEREKGLRIYDVDNNTDVHLIVKRKRNVFFHNNLQNLYGYENENPDWHKYYNATLVVPIRYLRIDKEQYRCYGFLAIDSLNRKKQVLYNDNECKYILAHAADLLATFFLLLEFIEYIKTQQGANAKEP